MLSNISDLIDCEPFRNVISILNKDNGGQPHLNEILKWTTRVYNYSLKPSQVQDHCLEFFIFG